MITQPIDPGLGSVALIDYWGSDERIIEAARMSTGKGCQGWVNEDGTERDTKLLRYLWEHQHHTPFEMAGMTVEVQAPIFVLREWQRHRTQSYNEMSGRYTRLPKRAYVPTIERLMGAKQSSKNKQGSEEGFSETEARAVQAAIITAHNRTYTEYEGLLAKGVAREIARLVLPVAQYSRMRASANLRNWLHFLDLRTAPDAQYEIRVYAEAIGELVDECFPHTARLWREGVEAR